MSIIRTARQQCFRHNIIEVEVGTTSPTDPIAYKGGKTYIRLWDGGGTFWKIGIKEESSKETLEFERPQEITLILEGESEAQTIAEALLFAGQRLIRQIEANDPSNLPGENRSVVEV